MIRCLRAWSPVVIISDHTGSSTMPFLQDPMGGDVENRMALLTKSHEPVEIKQNGIMMDLRSKNMRR